MFFIYMIYIHYIDTLCIAIHIHENMYIIQIHMDTLCIYIYIYIYIIFYCFNPNHIFCISSSPSFPFGECTSFPGSSDSKESTCNAGDLGSIPGLGRSPGGGHGNPL